MSCGIYKLVFKNTDKVYIGQSTDIEGRYARHLYTMRNGITVPKLQLAYNTYGAPALEILAECLQAELDIYEQETIEIYDSISNGFNTLPGGSSLAGTNNPGSKYRLEDYYNVLVLLSTPGISWKQISNSTGVSLNVISHISALDSHQWMEEKFPLEYAKLKNIRETTGRKTAYMQGMRYPNIISPTGEVYEVRCPTHFAKIHGLLQPKLHEVLNRTRKSHRGWHLDDYQKDVYPLIQSPEGVIYEIQKGKAVSFARTNNISINSLRNILARRQSSYLGWVLVD